MYTNNTSDYNKRDPWPNFVSVQDIIVLTSRLTKYSLSWFIFIVEEIIRFIDFISVFVLII